MSSLLLDSSRDTIGHNIMWKQQPKIFTYCINSPTSADGWNLKIKNCVYTSSSAWFENYYTWIIGPPTRNSERSTAGCLHVRRPTIKTKKTQDRWDRVGLSFWDRSQIRQWKLNLKSSRGLGGPTRFTWLAKLSLGSLPQCTDWSCV